MTPTSPVPVEVPTSLVAALAIAVVVLAGVVVVLFRLYISRNTAAETERRDHDKLLADERQSGAIRQKQAELELAAARADIDRRVREHAESYASELAELRDLYLSREDVIRKDCADRIERIAMEATSAAQKQNEVLNKIYERFVGPRRGAIR